MIADRSTTPTPLTTISDPVPTPTPEPVPTPTPELTQSPFPTPESNEPDPLLNGDPPKLLKATLRGDDITLQFDSVLSTTLPSGSRFTVSQKSKEYQIIDTKISSFDGIVTLTAEKDLDSTASLTLDYLDFDGDQKQGVVESSTGVDLESFIGFALKSQGSSKEANSLTIDDGEFEGSQIILFLTAPISET